MKKMSIFRLLRADESKRDEKVNFEIYQSKELQLFHTIEQVITARRMFSRMYLSLKNQHVLIVLEVSFLLFR